MSRSASSSRVETGVGIELGWVGWGAGDVWDGGVGRGPLEGWEVGGAQVSILKQVRGEKSGGAWDGKGGLAFTPSCPFDFSPPSTHLSSAFIPPFHLPCTFLPPSPPQGMLYKRTVVVGGKHWKRRFFVLDSQGLFYYYSQKVGQLIFVLNCNCLFYCSSQEVGK